jgi:cephalosporin hydroxylase
MDSASMTDAASLVYDPTAAKPPILAHRWSWEWLTQLVLRQYNRVVHAMVRRSPPVTDFNELAEVRGRAASLTDIDEHLELMFIEGLLCRPKVIVELGVRGGASTFVFERVAQLCGASLISCDIDDCAAASSNPRWHFFRGDDVKFAAVFPEFCRQRGIRPVVDLLFIDTSHYYEHTRQEIQAWFPLLSPSSRVMFHDTNLKGVGPRNDACFSLGWNNQRGVTRAIEEYLGIAIDEGRQCVAKSRGWLIRHWPNCNGLAILDKLPSK